MSSLLHRFGWLFLPILGAAIFAVDALAEAGRHPLSLGLRYGVPWWAALLALSVAVGLARLAPWVSMGLVTALLIGQVLFPAGIFDVAGMYLPILVVVAAAAATLHGRARVVVLGFAMGAGISVAGIACWWVGFEELWPVGPDPTSDGFVATVLTNRAIIFVSFAMLGAAAWGVGVLVGSWWAGRDALARTSDELRRAETETIVAGERERIAQDVHDIMAHSLSVILAQADGARSLADERPEAMAQSLETIASSARSSLTEVRMLIETLVAEPDGRAAPAVGDVDELVDRMRGAGLSIGVERYGEPVGLTATQELAVYRIVQEALTNALKHGGSGASARVVLDARGGGMMVSVASTGGEPVDAAARESGGGRGLHGMRERARLAGGWLDAGPDEEEGGGFLVTAFIPAAQAVLA
ncbi:sensor histidine kinase [Leifsonia aquatica]|uniref:sensor histidine kinase n=1 Tax=Leifsonia aquatica TaxID=144185 RepID=UPI00384E045C